MLDICHAYHMIHIAEGDEWKNTFQTRYGTFEWLVMPFGLTNTPAAFQCYMNNIFSDLLDVYVIIYQYDILIYFNDPAKHSEHICKVLCRLLKNGLCAHPDKWCFSSDTIEYLSFILS